MYIHIHYLCELNSNLFVMWTKELTIETDASRKQIWKLWSDVKNWNKWDKAVEYSELNGAFEVGATGFLKPEGGPKTKFVIQTVDRLTGFSVRTFLPLTKMDFTHRLKEKNGKLHLTHGIEIRGFPAFLFSRIIGKKIAAKLPEAMNNLSKMAQQ